MTIDTGSGAKIPKRNVLYGIGGGVVGLVVTVAVLSSVNIGGIDHPYIGEVELNPAGDDSGNEWLKLMNPTDATIDISGWKLTTSGGSRNGEYVFSPGTIMLPHSNTKVSFSVQALDNEGEQLVLQDASGNVVDRTPALTDTKNDGWTWKR